MERDRFIEVETSQEKEQIHLVQYGQGEEDFLVWHGFDSVNRFCAWKPLLKHGRVTLAGLPGHGPVRWRSWAQCKHWNQATKTDSLQIPVDQHRCHYVKARVRVHRYANGNLAVFHGPRRLADYNHEGRAITQRLKQAA